MTSRYCCWVCQGVREFTIVMVAQHACTSRTCPARARRARSQELQQRALQSSTDVPHAEDALDAFVEWLVANGVRGIGGEDSNVALYEEERGMRGVICLKVSLLMATIP